MRTNGKIQLFPFLRIAIMLAAGIVAGDAIGCSSPSMAACAATALMLTCACLLLWRHPIANSVALMLLTADIGAWLAMTNERTSPHIHAPRQVSLKAVVVSRPTRHGKTARCDLMVVDGRLMGYKVRASFLNDGMPDATMLRIGDGLTASTMPRPINDVPGTHNFSYARWARAHGFAGTALIRGDRWQCQKLSLTHCPWAVRAKIKSAKWRDKWLEVLRNSNLDEKATAIVAAMTLGEKSYVDKELRDVYSLAGVSHLLALSGLHLGIIYLLLSTLLVSRRTYYLGQAAVMTAVWLYVMLVGMPPSIVRAAIMLSVYTLASMLGNERMSLNALSVAAVVMMAANPSCIWDAGFQMSFLAVLSIIIFYHPIYDKVSFRFLKRHRLIKWIWASVSVSLASQICIAPVVAFYFERFACYFILSNLIAIPLTTAVIYGSLLLFALSWWPFAMNLAANVTAWLTNALEQTLRAVASLPGASIDNIHLNMLQVAMIYVVIACLYYICGFIIRLYHSATYFNPEY